MGQEEDPVEKIHSKGKRLFLEAWASEKIKPHALNNTITLPEVYKAILDKT